MSGEDEDFVAKAIELSNSGRFKDYIEVEAAIILLGYPSLVIERPYLAGDIDAMCKKAQARKR